MNPNVGSDALTQAELRWALDQALASSRIEGYIPTLEFLADREAVIAGTLTLEQASAASLKRALAADAAAAGGGVNGDAGKG
jgi:hypothetical protein